MSDIDVTKQRNHLFWLWLAYASLFGFVLFLHNEQSANIRNAERKAIDTNTQIQIELAQIKVKLSVVECQLVELNKNIKELAQ